MSGGGSREEEPTPGFAGSWKFSCRNRLLSHKQKLSGQRVKENWGVQVALLLDWEGRTNPSEEG